MDNDLFILFILKFAKNCIHTPFGYAVAQSLIKRYIVNFYGIASDNHNIVLL